MTELVTLRRSVRSFREIGWRRRALIVEASLWLVLSRVTLALVPFASVARRLGAFVPPSDPRVAAAGGATTEAAATLAREVRWAVTRGAAHAPFAAVCLPQAMAARIMLQRRGVSSAMHFGAARVEAQLDAHAWLDAAGVRVTGYPIAPTLAEIACFV